MSHAVLQSKTEVEKLQTGIDNRMQVAVNLAACVADTYVLLVKTQGYHWNVVGPLFHSIHILTEEHYRDLFEAADDLAERIRTLGYPAPSSIGEMVRMSDLIEVTKKLSTEEMIENLIADHELIARRFRDAVDHAEKQDDIVTADLLTARIAFHEKAVWMLKALVA